MRDWLGWMLGAVLMFPGVAWSVEAPEGLWEAVTDALYGVESRGGGLEAVSHRQDVVARFDGEGVEFERLGSEPVRVRMRLVGYGGEPVAEADPVRSGVRRVVYRRGVLDEWYENGPGGVEQGFTLREAPVGWRGGWLELELRVTGAPGEWLREGEVLGFGSGERPLRYAGLRVWDARGEALVSRMEWDAERGRVGLVVEVPSDAAWPLTVDPVVATEEAKLMVTSGQALGFFGSSVALSGGTALVGAPYVDVGGNVDRGAAYVFVRDPNTGAWSQQAKLTASDGAADDYFGQSVALAGDTALVGADRADVGGNADQGAAYVFVRSGTSWNQQAKLTASDGAANDYFGYSVALAGDTALVGAPSKDGLYASQGAAYVFVRSGTTWSPQRKLTASDGAANDEFGTSVALSGDTALVGADRADVSGNADQGAAYVFVRSGTSWNQQAKLTASDGAANDYFGWSVALSGDTALVGAYWADVGGNADQGAAYVFGRSGTSWNQQAKLTAPDGAADDYFGGSVALSGDTALVGAYLADVSGNVDQGAAYVFVPDPNTGAWNQQQKLTTTDGAAGDLFGLSVALAGDTALVGAPYKNDTFQWQGVAYVFVRSGASWNPKARLTASDGAAYDEFGVSVALAGDAALVGAPFADVGGNANQGAAYVFGRSGANWSEQAKLTAPDGASGDLFGWSVALSGDTALVGAIRADVGGNTDQGAAYVYRFVCGYGRSLPANQWVMWSLPCHPKGVGNTATVQDVFDELPAGGYGSSWVVYRWDAVQGAYVMLSLADTVEPGVGYWVYTGGVSQWSADTATGAGRDAVAPQPCPGAMLGDCYVLRLEAASGAEPLPNLVGLPRLGQVSWADMRIWDGTTLYTPSQAAALGLVADQYWVWNGTSYDAYSSTTPGLDQGHWGGLSSYWVKTLAGSVGWNLWLVIPAGP